MGRVSEPRRRDTGSRSLPSAFAAIAPIPVPQTCDGERAMEGQALARAELVGMYQRGSP